MTKGAYGWWHSPLTPAMMAEERRLSEVAWSRAGDRLLWVEGRSGKNVLVAGADGDAPCDLTVEGSVRGGVGYGGGDMAPLDDGVVYCRDGRLQRLAYDHGVPRSLTPAYGSVASPAPSPDGRWIVYVHSDGTEDVLAVVDTDGKRWPQKLASGADFYTSPTWHPDGRRLAWVEWDHPNMPWDGTRLVLATVCSADAPPPAIPSAWGRPHAESPSEPMPAPMGQGPWSAVPSLVMATHVAGDEDTAATEPLFSPDGRWLAYICDASGWDDLYLYDLRCGQARRLTFGGADYGQPAWAQGIRSYAWDANSSALYAVRRGDARDALWRVPLDGGEPEPVRALADYGSVQQPTVSADGRLACIASSHGVPPRLLVWNPHDDTVRVRARASAERLNPAGLVEPTLLTWRGEDGEEVYGLLYQPVGGPQGQRPPLMVSVHGGPTGRAKRGWDPAAQFLATRGWAVLALDYRGSSGYGRAYRNRLRGNWGLLDVADAVSGAQHCAQRGLVNDDRMAIMGGSAGGYTVLETLAQHPGVFAAGVCMYGVTDLFALAEETHKFEARYTDRLVGLLPEAAAAYRERSPARHADRIRDAVAIFQGEEDKVVPLSQAEALVAALREQGVPHTYRTFAGEGHGWRRRETIVAFWEETLTFLRRHLLYA
jgi:dipeptidyl aminopeptidase/acylaminoacyl peptidase